MNQNDKYISIASVLLASTSVLEILPTIQQKVEFADRAIKTVIGLTNSGFCLKGYTPSKPIDAICMGCKVQDEASINDKPFDCPLHNNVNYRLIPLSTTDTFFGNLLVYGESINQIVLYDHLILNFLTILSVSIDDLIKSLSLENLNSTLRESEERFHSLFDNMSEGVALHELVYDGGTPVNYRIVDINNSYLKIIGGSRNQVIGKLSTDAYNTTTPPYLDQYIEVALNKKPIYFETYYQLMDKQFAISVIPWHQSGFATIFTDISERKQAEQAIRLKSEELQKNNAEKDKFFSIIAHDLRSPFNSFLGLTQIMAEELPTLSINEIQKIAISMKTSATNLYRLLENLLEWSLIQQGLFPFNPEVVQLFPIISESIELIVETAKAKNVEILVSVPKDLTVFADNNTLQTVIRNLVSNALKFTPKGGKITVSAKMNDDKRVEISVKDTGIGMDQSILDNLFRLDVNTCRKGTEGELSTGLGLLLCSDFIEKHGGKLLIESQEGMGSTFYFTIPTEE